MTIVKIYIEFHKITSCGCPWKVLGGSLGGLGEALGVLGVSLGDSLEVIGGLRGLFGKFDNSTIKMSQMSYVEPSNEDGDTNEIVTTSQDNAFDS